VEAEDVLGETVAGWSGGAVSSSLVLRWPTDRRTGSILLPARSARIARQGVVDAAPVERVPPGHQGGL